MLIKRDFAQLRDNADSRRCDDVPRYRCSSLVEIESVLISVITSFADDTLTRGVNGAKETRLSRIAPISKNHHSDLFTGSSGIMHAAIDLSRCGTRCKHIRRSPTWYSDNTDNNLWRQEMAGTLITTCPAYSMSALFYYHDNQRRNRTVFAVPSRKISAHLHGENRTG